jgi:hypothetical protein
MLKAIRRWLLDRKLRRVPVLPRLKHTAFLKAVERMSMALDRQPVPSDQFPISRPFVADIIVTFCLDLGDKYVALTPALLERVGLDPEYLEEVAVLNFVKRWPKMRGTEDHGLFTLCAGPDVTAGVALMDDLWDEFTDHYGGDLVAAIPNRNTLLYTRADNPSAGCHACTALGASMPPAPAFVPNLHPPIRRLCCALETHSAHKKPNPAQPARASAPRDPQNAVFTPARIFHLRIFHIPIFGNVGNTLVTPPKTRRNHTSDSAHPSSRKSGDSREIRAAPPRNQPRAWCAPGGGRTLFAPFRNLFATGAQQTRVG